MTKPLKDFDADEAARTMYYNLAATIGFGLGVLLGFLIGGLWPLVTGPLMAYLVRKIASSLVDGGSRAFTSFVLPDERGGAGVGYSHIDALEIKGDVPGALAAWEVVIAETPDAIGARVSAAELYTRKGNDHARAATLYRSVQAHANAPDETKRYVTQRLIDLYLGPLKDEGRALVELRRVANRWPDSPEGKGALQAIANIKNL